MKASSLNIAQVKRKCGLELAENFNLPKIDNSRQPQCPKEKEEAIVEATSDSGSILIPIEDLWIYQY